MARRRRGRRRAAKKNPQNGLTLKTVSLLAYLFFIFIFAVALWLSLQSSFSQVRDQQRGAKEAISISIADQLAKTVASYAQSLEGVARDPAMINLLRESDKSTIEQRSAELVKVFPHALSLRLYRHGEPKLDESVTPPVKYACLDLIRKIDKGDKAPVIEIHLPRSKDHHLEIVRPVYSKGETLLGYIQLTLDLKAVQYWLKGVVKENYIELRQFAGEQEPILIGKGGDVSLRTSEASYYEIEGTPWKVAVWSKVTIPAVPIKIEVVFIFLISVLLIGAAVYFLMRSVSNAIRLDASTLTKLTIDSIRGGKPHDYQMFMAEFEDAARQIKELSEANPIERERDDDPDAVHFSADDIDALDPLYMTSDGVSVEEVDEDELNKSTSSGFMTPPAATNNTSGSRSMQTPATSTSGQKAVFSGQDVKTQTAMPKQAPKAQAPSTSGQKSVFEAHDLKSSSGMQSVSSVRQPLAEMPPAEIFKAYDIRGIVGTSLSAEHAGLIGKAIGSEAIERGLTKLAFARDGRLSGPDLGKAFVQGVISTGVDIIDVGMVPTPVLYYAATLHADGSGVMLTGSHNPPDYNGFKMMLGGETLSGDQIQQLRKRIESKDFKTGQGNYINEGVAKAYIERIVSDVKLARPLKVVIDCGNGVAGAVAPVLFKKLGCQLIELFCDVDGHFPNHHPDPSKPDNMRDLIAAVKANNADIGLAFDGDGDRLGVIDSAGKMIYPDRLMMLFAGDVLSRQPGAQIIYDIKCSNNLTRSIWEKGGEPLMWKTGHSLIKAKMKQTGAALAGEMSGHIFFAERWFGFDDGMYSGARLLEIISTTRESTQQIFDALPDACNTPEINVSMTEGAHHKFIDDMMEKADFGDANVTMIDGIRADFADGWGLVRASNTTPVLVLRFEGKDQKALQRIQQAFKNQILAVKPDLKLPF